MRRTNRLGMTLIEIMIVVVIIGIVAAMALPKAIRIQRQMELEASAQQLVRELSQVKARAVKESRAISFRRDNGIQYRLGDTETRELPPGLRFTGVSAAEIRFASFGPPITGPAMLEIEAAEISRRKRVLLNATGYLSLE